MLLKCSATLNDSDASAPCRADAAMCIQDRLIEPCRTSPNRIKTEFLETSCCTDKPASAALIAYVTTSWQWKSQSAEMYKYIWKEQSRTYSHWPEYTALTLPVTAMISHDQLATPVQSSAILSYYSFPMTLSSLKVVLVLHDFIIDSACAPSKNNNYATATAKDRGPQALAHNHYSPATANQVLKMIVSL